MQYYYWYKSIAYLLCYKSLFQKLLPWWNLFVFSIWEIAVESILFQNERIFVQLDEFDELDRGSDAWSRWNLMSP